MGSSHLSKHWGPPHLATSSKDRFIDHRVDSRSFGTTYLASKIENSPLPRELWLAAIDFALDDDDNLKDLEGY